MKEYSRKTHMGKRNRQSMEPSRARRQLSTGRRSRLLAVISTVAAIGVFLGACGSSPRSSVSKSTSTSATAGPPPSSTTSVAPVTNGTGTTGTSTSSTIATAPEVPASLAMVSWETLPYPDQAQCALPDAIVVSPLAFDATISGAPYYFRGNSGQDFAVIPLRCTGTNSLTDMVLLYQGTNTSEPQLWEVLVAGTSPVSSFGVPVETVATSFTAVLAPKGMFANFHSGSLALCGGVAGTPSGVGGPYYLNTFFFTEKGLLFALSSHASSPQPSSAGGPCPGE